MSRVTLRVRLWSRWLLARLTESHPEWMTLDEVWAGKWRRRGGRHQVERAALHAFTLGYVKRRPRHIRDAEGRILTGRPPLEYTITKRGAKHLASPIEEDLHR